MQSTNSQNLTSLLPFNERATFRFLNCLGGLEDVAPPSSPNILCVSSILGRSNSSVNSSEGNSSDSRLTSSNKSRKLSRPNSVPSDGGRKSGNGGVGGGPPPPPEIGNWFPGFPWKGNQAPAVVLQFVGPHLL